MVKQLSFEQGPIRPPSEARSLLLRVTRNCPWNQCLFCNIYKTKTFSIRTIEEVKEDIRTVRAIADAITSLSWQTGSGGRVDDQVISRIFSGSSYGDHYRGIAAWLYFGAGACFLQDADNLIMKTDDLVEILRYLRDTFPEISRVTTYSRARTIYRKTLEDLKRLRRAGLDRIHVGLESGNDPVLKFMKKGVSAERHIEAGRKVVEAGMELSEYVMPGLGGRAMWREHAEDSARVLNQINPQFIRIRSLRVPERVPLYAKIQSGDFAPQTDDSLVEEIRVFIEHLDGITSVVTSDHIMNLLEEVTGRLPDEKDGMLAVIAAYQRLPERDRLIYRLGRRGGAYRSTQDLEGDPATYKKIENLVDDLLAEGGPQAVEDAVRDLADQYI